MYENFGQLRVTEHFDLILTNQQQIMECHQGSRKSYWTREVGTFEHQPCR